MPRPKAKQELLDLSQKNYQSLMKLVDSLPENILHSEFPEGTLNRNVRDVLTHLHEWHLMLLGWYEVDLRGGKPQMPAKGYTWQTLPDLNKEIWKKYQNVDVTVAMTTLKKSYTDVRNIILKHTDEELFEKKRYAWTGSTSLGAYLISNTSSHYAWAIKIIKKSLKN